MSKIQLDLIVGSGNEDDRYYIDGIPPRLWEQFKERAKAIMPEKGNDAWAGFLSEAIASVCDGSSYTFVMSDIPNEAKAGIDEACRQAKINADGLIAHIWKAGMDKTIHVIAFHNVDEEEPPHALTIIGLPDSGWNAWSQLAEQVKEKSKEQGDPESERITPEMLIARMFEAAARGGLQLEARPNGA